MVDLDKQFAAMADVSEEDTAYDFVIDEDLRVIAVPERGVVLGVEGDKDVLYCGGPYYHWRNGELCVPHDAW